MAASAKELGFLITGLYVVVAFFHAALARKTQTLGLTVLSANLAFDSFVLAIGGIRALHGGVGRGLLETLGRVRFFANALAWPLFLSFGFSLAASCEKITIIDKETAATYEHLVLSAAKLCALVFIAREAFYVWQWIRNPERLRSTLIQQIQDHDNKRDFAGRRRAGAVADEGASVRAYRKVPPQQIQMAAMGASASDLQDTVLGTLPGGSQVAGGDNPQMGDCLPKNAIFGGFFRPSASEADNGRLVFEPVPERTGLYIAPGLVMLEHLFLGLGGAWNSPSHLELPPLFFGAVVGFLGRQLTSGRWTGASVPSVLKSEAVNKLLLRWSEIAWLFCCYLQERECAIGREKFTIGTIVGTYFEVF